jgi:Protein of unknown function (DUF2505)
LLTKYDYLEEKMAKKIAKTIHFETSPENLLAILTNLDFQVDREKAQDAVEASVKVISQDDNKIVYDVFTKEYAKSVKGIDKTKTDDSTCTYTWDLNQMTASWDYVGPYGSKVKVWGNMKIIPAGDYADLYSDFNVDIKIPLIGGKIASVVVSKANEQWNRHDDLVREYIKKV